MMPLVNFLYNGTEVIFSGSTSMEKESQDTSTWTQVSTAVVSYAKFV